MNKITLVLLLTFVIACGSKHKMSVDPIKMEIPNSVQTVNVNHTVDLATAFEQLADACMRIHPDDQKRIAACTQDNFDKLMDVINSSKGKGGKE